MNQLSFKERERNLLKSRCKKGKDKSDNGSRIFIASDPAVSSKFSISSCFGSTNFFKAPVPLTITGAVSEEISTGTIDVDQINNQAGQPKFDLITLDVIDCQANNLTNISSVSTVTIDVGQINDESGKLVLDLSSGTLDVSYINNQGGNPAFDLSTVDVTDCQGNDLTNISNIRVLSSVICDTLQSSTTSNAIYLGDSSGIDFNGLAIIDTLSVTTSTLYTKDINGGDSTVNVIATDLLLNGNSIVNNSYGSLTNADGTQLLSSGTTSLILDTVNSFNNAIPYPVDSSPTSIQVSKTAIYKIDFYGQFTQALGITNAQCYLSINGSTVTYPTNTNACLVDPPGNCSMSTIIPLNNGDIIGINCNFSGAGQIYFYNGFLTLIEV